MVYDLLVARICLDKLFLYSAQRLSIWHAKSQARAYAWEERMRGFREVDKESAGYHNRVLHIRPEHCERGQDD